MAHPGIEIEISPAVDDLPSGVTVGMGGKGMHTFFDLEETYGIHEIDGELCLRLDRSRKDYTELFDMLLKWNEARKSGQADFDSSAAYEEWKLHYPPSIR